MLGKLEAKNYRILGEFGWVGYHCNNPNKLSGWMDEWVNKWVNENKSGNSCSLVSY